MGFSIIGLAIENNIHPITHYDQYVPLSILVTVVLGALVFGVLASLDNRLSKLEEKSSLKGEGLRPKNADKGGG
jgi:hypothetical protein